RVGPLRPDHHLREQDGLGLLVRAGLRGHAPLRLRARHLRRRLRHRARHVRRHDGPPQRRPRLSPGASAMPTAAPLDARPVALRYNDAGTLAAAVVFELVTDGGDGTYSPYAALDGAAFQWALAPDGQRNPAARLRLDAAVDG